jgi:hypothetical protein
MEFRLKDGRAVTVRPFKPEDFEAMLAMFESLSAEALRYGLPPYDALVWEDGFRASKVESSSSLLTGGRLWEWR